ncbi:MAG: efflux RND transporter periplasmic adaptor subunit [Paludibacterium sp.]|uniref:efflux RND transporter periplasmic adaptor subunit n=1 Tax=Paludibacterium sp. TaxID=1917523 RepID=UPI0025F3DB3D|nr:efflux RND transporter periplasmic adaptor subunit [Paludibacterium sp.]MBV8046713.1 efflux RND transporter periplasmic adaptor subunit [Paludibacterium sp.]MBV8646804.1 efflux RND transporter periplasmic adaptor subunit [Paludibacterium sp.]
MMLTSRTLFALTLGALACLGCSGKPAASEPPLPQVAAASPQAREITDTIDLDGTVAPSATVNLVARVSGYLQSAPFTEGQIVKQGQLLFVIEPEPYQQEVKLNQAKLEQARAEYQRQQVLMKENATAQSSVETAQSNLQQAEANLRLAQINLDYASVRAPFDGVIGKRTVDVGNYVGASAGGTVLATLQRLRPVYVNFSINERDLLRLRTAQGRQSASDPKAGVGSLQVGVALQGEATASAHGTLDFIDNNLSASTGTLSLRATFENRDLHLIPGLYAKVTIPISKPHPALLLPATAILNDQLGSYVFVLGDDMKVARRDVKLGAEIDQAREVTQGLAAQDRVVIAGLSGIGNGQKVAVQTGSTSQ